MKNLHVTTTTTTTKHTEGETWEEGGKLWTIKNGIKRTVTKMDHARKEFLTPLACPECGASMKHHLDEKMWAIHRRCFNCVIDMEHEIMKAGNWEEYERNKITANANSFVRDLEDYVQEFIQDQTSKSHVTEDGLIEKWKEADAGYLKQIGETVVNEVKQNIENFRNDD